MAYIKISDPAIVDLSAIQQIISVVNNHSDYLNALINKFGATYDTDWNSDDFQANFDIATSNIIYGKVTITPEDSVGSGSSKYYAKEFTFDTGITFATTPNVILTHNNTDGTQGGQLDIVVSLHNCTTSGFTARAYRSRTSGTPDAKTISGNVEINFIAFGRR